MRTHARHGVTLIAAAMVALVISGAPRILSAESATGGGAAALSKAAQANKYLFIFFYKDSGKGVVGGLLGRDNKRQTEAMGAVFEAAAVKSAGKADSVRVNVQDPAEKAIVDKFDVSRAPVPLALVVAPNGAITGGFPGKFEESQLLGAFASPGMEKCLKVLQDNKLVFLCVQNDGTRANQEAMKGV
jgi:hypothetical protein